MTVNIIEIINNDPYKPRKISKLKINPDKICPVCNKRFYDTTRNRKYCSQECAEKIGRIQRNAYCKEYYQRTKGNVEKNEKRKAYNRAYYHRNKEKYRIYQKKRQEKLKLLKEVSNNE